MRKWMISLLSILALAFMFTGCGDSGSVSSVSIADSTPVVIDNGEGAVEITTPSTPYNLSSNLGTPPGLPAE